MPKRKASHSQKGKLRIGDHWNAITIIALSQQSPLKAVAELVENSIDAHAKNVVITRGRQKGQPYLRIMDDGHGIPRDANGLPDFHYVATHICDSLKRHLKREDRKGIQGEFGIGLLSFWTLGEELILTSTCADGRTFEMRMRKGDPSYSITERRRLYPEKGTEVLVRPLLAGIRHLSGEKMQWYLASELRDRIKRSGVQVRIVDRQARSQYQVTPREYEGELLQHLPAVETTYGEVYLEIYLNETPPNSGVGLFRHGTRVLENIEILEDFQNSPWNTGYLQGIIDAPFINITPGTRTGIVRDRCFAALREALKPLERVLEEAVEAVRHAAEEKASRQILRSIHRAFREALLALPQDEYDWFKISDAKVDSKPGVGIGGSIKDERASMADGEDEGKPLGQRKFFDFPGPLYSVVISPASCTVPVGQDKNLRAVPRDRQRRLVEENLDYHWEIIEGSGELSESGSEIVTFHAPQEPGLTRLRAHVNQAALQCQAEGTITVTDELLPELPKPSRNRQGLPAYTFERRPGELWRSRYEEERNLIIINNAHRDFIYASRSKVLKLRYICRLYIKELVYRNFTGLPAEILLERMVELSLYTEEHLK